MGRRRNAIRLGSIGGVLLALILVLVIATPASASPAIPGIPDCKDAPAAQLPGNGLPGFLDGKPDPLPVRADPFAKSPTTSVYEQYGYAGLSWHTYDLGCGGDLRDVNASTDTMIGNATLAFATWAVAGTNGIHNKIAHPADYMAPLDDVVTTVSTRLKDAIWSPWGGAALLGVVVLLLWYSSAGRLSSVTKAAAWAVLVLAVMSGIAQYPARISAFFDETVTGSIGQVNAATAGLSSVPQTSDPARAQGGLLVDRLLYDSWLRGEFGSPDSAAAKRWGPAVFKASAYTWAEAEQARDPAKAKQLAEGKAQSWKSIAAQIQEQDPNAYLALQGKAADRAGVGIMAVFGVAFTSIFRMVADLFMFAGLIMLRFLVMFFPAVAVLGVMAPMSAIVHRVANMAGASVVNVISFAVGAAVHTTVVSALLARASTGGMNLLVLILCLVSTLVAFVLLFPLLSLTNIAGMASGGRGAHALRNAGRFASRYGMAKGAVGTGAVDAKLVGSPSTDKRRLDPAASASGTMGSGRYRMLTTTAESFGRPEQRSQPRALPVGAGTSSPSGRVLAGRVMDGRVLDGRSSDGRVLDGRSSEGTARNGGGPASSDSATLFDPATRSRVGRHRHGTVVEEAGHR